MMIIYGIRKYIYTYLLIASINNLFFVCFKIDLNKLVNTRCKIGTIDEIKLSFLKKKYNALEIEIEELCSININYILKTL